VWESGVLAAPPPDGLPLLVAVDDEGGRVQPMEGVLEDLPSAAELGQQPAEDLEALAAERGAALRELGVNVAFAPVVDVGGGGGIGDRSFGDTSEAVVMAAGAYAEGLRSSDVLPVLKHFPGHGHADADTHDGPATTPELSLLRTSDLVPYAELLDDGEVGVMIGHLDVPGLTEAGLPASLSSGAVGLLRAGYEFDGLTVTDDLAAMGAVTARFDPPEASERALAAGVDLLLLARSSDVGAVLDRLEDAVTTGRIPGRRVDAAVGRVAAVGCPG
jgi:beta-N-acetylhexosaminidase